MGAYPVELIFGICKVSVGKFYTVPNVKDPLPTHLDKCLKNILSNSFCFSVFKASSDNDSLFAICSILMIISLEEFSIFCTSLNRVSDENRFLRKSIILVLFCLSCSKELKLPYELIKSAAVLIMFDSISFLCSSYWISSWVALVKTLVNPLFNAYFLLGCFFKSNSVANAGYFLNNWPLLSLLLWNNLKLFMISSLWINLYNESGHWGIVYISC